MSLLGVTRLLDKAVSPRAAGVEENTAPVGQDWGPAGKVSRVHHQPPSGPNPNTPNPLASPLNILKTLRKTLGLDPNWMDNFDPSKVQTGNIDFNRDDAGPNSWNGVKGDFRRVQTWALGSSLRDTVAEVDGLRGAVEWKRAIDAKTKGEDPSIHYKNAADFFLSAAKTAAGKLGSQYLILSNRAFEGKL